MTLAIETAGRGGSVVLGRDGVVSHAMDLPRGRRHNVQLALGIQQLLSEAGVTQRDLGAVAVALGPGSFTGIRVGVTTANTLAYALGLPAIGVPSMDVLVQNTPADIESVCVALNAKRGSVYAGRFVRDASVPTGFREAGARALVPLAQVVAWGLPVIGEALAELLPEAQLLDASLAQGRAAAVLAAAVAPSSEGVASQGTAVGGAFSGVVASGAGGALSGGAAFGGPAKLVPLYIREPEAVTLWEARKQASAT